MADAQLAKEACAHFKKLGLDIRLGAKVTKATAKGDGVRSAMPTPRASSRSWSTRWSSRSAADPTRRSCSAPAPASAGRARLYQGR